MKLRIRSLESKETLKIETPNPSSLQDLKHTIAEKLSCSSEILHLSLNRKDKIIASPTDSLTSLGIASGDLIYYTRNPNGFTSQPPIQFLFQPIHLSKPEPMEICKDSSTSDGKALNLDEKTETLGQVDETLVQNDETLDSDEGIDENSAVLVKNISSVPCFLQKVYKEEVGEGKNTEGDHKLLVIAVHAVFLESGFVCFDSLTQKKVDGYRLPMNWAEKATVTIQYTVPELLNIGSDVLVTVDLKFQSLGKFVSVHGSLSKQNPVGFFRLDASRFVQPINFVCMSSEEADGSFKSSHEKEVFELWRIAKDGLALPLLIDLCEKAGLEPPPCFMCLPMDLKMKILELLPAVDIARVGCVSSELKYLSSNNDLWKQKYMEEFSVSGSGEMQWKKKYVIARERNKRRRRPFFQPSARYPTLPLRREPRSPFGFPGIIGGDYDLFPAPLGFPAPFGSNQVHPFPARRNVKTRCNLGGFDV